MYRVSVLVFWPVKFHASTMLQLGDQDYSLEVRVQMEDGCAKGGGCCLCCRSLRTR